MIVTVRDSVNTGAYLELVSIKVNQISYGFIGEFQIGLQLFEVDFLQG